LHGPLHGYYKIKLRKAGYRLVYRVDEANRKLVVTAVGRRDAASVYAEAVKRMT
jgi:mRNA interferase RelE/StbE